MNVPQTLMSPADTAELKRLENVIEHGLQTFEEVGEALAAIKDERLYVGTHSTFDHYVRERWGMSRYYAHRTIEAAQVTAMLPIGNTPSSEAVARELAPLRSDPVLLEKVWSAATAEHGKPTAKQVKAIREQQSPLRVATLNDKPTATKAHKPSKALNRIDELGSCISGFAQGLDQHDSGTFDALATDPDWDREKFLKYIAEAQLALTHLRKRVEGRV